MTVEQMKAMNVCTRFLDAHPIVDGMLSYGNPVADAQEQFMFKYAVEQVRKQHKNPATTIGIEQLRMFVHDWCERHPDQSMVRAMYGYVPSTPIIGTTNGTRQKLARTGWVGMATSAFTTMGTIEKPCSCRAYPTRTSLAAATAAAS
jgi:hypothetical protein